MGVDPHGVLRLGMLFMEPATRDVLCCACWYHCAMATRRCGIAGGFAVDYSCAWCMLGVAVSVGSVKEGVSLGMQELGTLPHRAVVVGVAVIGLLNGVSAAHHRYRGCASHHDPLCDYFASRFLE